VYNWFLAFFSAGILFLLITVFHGYFLPEVEKKKKTVLNVFLGLFKVKVALFSVFASLVIYSIRVFLYSDFFSKLKLSYPFLKKVCFSHIVAIVLLAVLVVLAAFTKKIKIKLEQNSTSAYAKAFLTFIDRDKIGIILAFIILLRTGEWMLSSMVAPLMVDLGIKVHYGWLSAMVGLPASIAGAMVGGFLISKYSMRKMLWPFILAQNLTNIVYMILAIYLSHFILVNTNAAVLQPIGIFNLFLVACVQGFDKFAGGLGTAVLMTFLMKICVENYKAAHYAIGSGLMSITGMFAGVVSGIIAGRLGYAWLFGISFLASIPAMALIPFLPERYNQ
jgi:PAT family beta-lactamase induction signal transducer AmpG